MVSSIRNIVDANFSRIDRELAEVKALLALHTAKFTSIECKMEAALGGLRGEVGATAGELISIRAEFANLRALVLERMPKS